MKADIIAACQLMDRKGWVANHDGNLSVRLDSDRYLVTPTARAKRDLQESDLIEVDSSGKTISGDARVFSEFRFHQKVFENRDKVSVVIHSHSPSATAVGLAQQEIQTSAIPEAVVSLGPGIPCVGLGLPDSQQVLEEFSRLVPHYDALFVAGNGVFSWGPTLELAFLRMELVEHLATIFVRTLPLGAPKTLAPEEVRALLAKREKAGLALPPDPEHSEWFSV